MASALLSAALSGAAPVCTPAGAAGSAMRGRVARCEGAGGHGHMAVPAASSPTITSAVCRGSLPAPPARPWCWPAPAAKLAAKSRQAAKKASSRHRDGGSAPSWRSLHPQRVLASVRPGHAAHGVRGIRWAAGRAARVPCACPHGRRAEQEAAALRGGGLDGAAFVHAEVHARRNLVEQEAGAGGAVDLEVGADEAPGQRPPSSPAATHARASGASLPLKDGARRRLRICNAVSEANALTSCSPRCRARRSRACCGSPRASRIAMLLSANLRFAVSG